MPIILGQKPVKTFFTLANGLLPVVLITYIIRKVLVLAIEFAVTGKNTLRFLVDNLTLRSEEAEIIVDGILKLEPGQQYYFGTPGIDGIFVHLGHIFLLAWQFNIVMKWAQFKLLGKDSGLTGIFTPVLDLGTIRLFFLVALPVTLVWFFNPLLVEHPLAYPYSLIHYFNAVTNRTGLLLIIILVILLVNSPLIARLAAAPGLIVHGRFRVIDAIADSFRILSTVTGLKVIAVLLVLGGIAMYMAFPGSLFQYPITSTIWLQWIIKGVNLFAVNFLWSMLLGGLSLLYYRNKTKLNTYS